MITTGLTNSDLKLLDMNLDELKMYQEKIMDELSELNIALDALGKDPEMIFSETVHRVDAYFENRSPES